MRCILATLKLEDDWRGITIFRTHIEVLTRVARSSLMVEAIWMQSQTLLWRDWNLKPNIAWVDKIPWLCSHWCVMPIQFISYLEEIGCDIFCIDVAHILLGRFWCLTKAWPIIEGPTHICLCRNRITLSPSKLKLIQSGQTKSPKVPRVGISLHHHHQALIRITRSTTWSLRFHSVWLRAIISIK